MPTNNPLPEDLLRSQGHRANSAAESAYWWMKAIDADTARRIGLTDQVQAVLSLLQKVDNITIDIIIRINTQSTDHKA